MTENAYSPCPAANLLRSFTKSQKLFRGKSLYARQRSLTEKLLAASRTEQEASVSLAHELLRLKTFEALNLTHTCCDGNCDLRKRQSPTPEETEIDEIQDEERILIAQLEELVAEFDFEFERRQEPLLAFLDGYWTERMEEVLAESDSSDEEAIRQIEELGVKVRK
ncbi:hypothetical protein H2199_008403 [Coniosporium tulheliwenetii]|uniref:Uncharacterized protein n=1 Tax=Coniosporium tulheliwenetii TaxID=3383036 RepID=A0ACC2YJL6_9PEZI|nr:hypothetical protein H2199_008403 [Cladosporium sp. JES 115]